MYERYLDALDRCRSPECVVRAYRRFMSGCVDVIRHVESLFRRGRISDGAASTVLSTVESLMERADYNAVERFDDILSDIGYRYRQEVNKIAYRSFLKT